ncbi:MAG: TonB-dependent receptor [Bacteroidetes bacterium]|nr:TonB-dependent receptor [Bacteroidota bacterium]
MRILLVNFFLLSTLCLYSQNFTVSGTITDEQSGEVLPYVSVFIPETQFGTTSNTYGYFSLSLPLDTYKLNINCMGYVPLVLNVNSGTPANLKIFLKKEIQKTEVIRIARKKSQLEEIHNSTQMSTIKIPVKDIKNIPTIGGESDLIKVVQLLPGVQRGGEGQTGMFVRGGDADQNLVILDEAVVYNIGHLFGFFSVFNSDAIKELTLIKGAFPGNYGGRLSSVLDIKMNDGNMTKFSGAGGVGLLSSRLTLAGPIVKNKVSFMLSGRRTYIDQVFKAVKLPLPYYFYDLNGKLNFVLGQKDRLYLSSYLGNDILAVSDKSDNSFGFGFKLGNITNTLRWNHVFGNRLFANTSLINTLFDYDITGKFEQNSLFISSKVNDYGLKTDFNYYHSNAFEYKFGAQIIEHVFRPNIISTSGEISDVLKSKTPNDLHALEYAMYGNMDWSLMQKKLQITSALRISGCMVKNKTYIAPEPRFSMKYSITKNDIVKASYARMNQYMHLVSSSTVALPTDLWYPVTAGMKPQSSDQVAVGYSRMLPKIGTNISVEGYYKWMDNLVEYKEGANLVLNDHFEKELLQGKGNAYGVEFLVKRDEGRISGWVGYTLSWANRYFPELNNGTPYPARYDRRHNLNIVANVKLTERWIFSAVFVYSSGARFTPQIGAYTVPNASFTGVEIIPVFTSKNAISMAATNRLDINFVRKCKPVKGWKGEWHFGAYNVYNSNTPYRIYLQMDEAGRRYMQKGLFGFIPSVAYNFEF